MIITCENCDTSFNLDENILKPTGSKVRCSQCRHIFTAFPPSPPEEEAPSEAIPPEPEEEAFAAQADDAALAASAAVAAVAEGVSSEAEEVEPADGETEPDFQMDFQEEAEETPVQAAVEEESLPEQAEAEADADEEMQLGIDLEPESEAAAEDELDLSDVEGLLDMEAEAGEEVPVESETAEELDLSDVEGLLDMEAEAGEEAPAEADAGEEDLDLDFDLEPEEGEAPAAAGKELDLSDVEGLLDMEEEAGEEALSEADAADDELELDLDMELEMEGAPSEASPTADGDALEDLDLDLDLGIDDEVPAVAEMPEEIPSASDDQELEDLDFELDMEFTDEGGETAPDSELELDEPEDLDLTDIEGMLEEGEQATPAAAETEKWKTQSEAPDILSETAELDLSDIEKMLDMDDEIEEVDEEEVEDVELDLDIGDDTADAGLEMVDGDATLEMDVSDLDEGISEENLVFDDPFEGGDIELEFEVDEDTDGGAFSMDEDLEAPDEDFEVPDEAAGVAAAVAVAEPEVKEDKKAKKVKKVKKKKPKKPKPLGKRRGSGKGLLLILLLLILGIAAIFYLDMMMGIKTPYASDYLRQLPYVGDFLKPVVKDIGEIKMLEINSKFIDNSKSGKLLVITGKVKNSYKEPRSQIRIRGKLFTTGKTLVQTQTVYGGNILTDLDLVSMDLSAIKKRFSNRVGDNKSNYKVKPGKILPFMVVFASLPDDLEEFVVEPAGSVPGVSKKKK